MPVLKKTFLINFVNILPFLFFFNQVEFVQQLPKTITGKIRRNELRKKEWGQM